MRSLPPAEQTVLTLIEAAAGGGRPCPSNDALAGAIGAKSVATAARVVASLEARGLIAVERGNKTRMVTILSSGARTQAAGVAAGRVRGPRRADELAELVAEGATLAGAARTMGVSEARVHQIWAWIRQQLGPQAC